MADWICSVQWRNTVFFLVSSWKAGNYSQHWNNWGLVRYFFNNSHTPHSYEGKSKLSLVLQNVAVSDLSLCQTLLTILHRRHSAFFSATAVQTSSFWFWVHHHLAIVQTTILETSMGNVLLFCCQCISEDLYIVSFSFASSALSFEFCVHPFFTGRVIRVLMQLAKVTITFLELLTVTKGFLYPFRKVWWWRPKHWHQTFMLPLTFLKASAVLGLSSTL